MVELITLYTADVCPYAHRAEIALEEAGATYKRYAIDLANKPEWYAPKVNPASKVPAIAYGGPDVPPDQPSPESIKIPESLIIVEFIADLFPDSGILPKDPVQRAKAKLFADTVGNKFTPGWYAFSGRGESPDLLFKGIEAIQNALPDNGKYALGDQFSFADISIATFLLRLESSLSLDLGKFEAGEGKKVWETLQTDPKYEKFRKYLTSLKERESVTRTYKEDGFLAVYKSRFPRL